MKMKQLIRHGMATTWFPIYRFLSQLPGPQATDTFRILSLHHVSQKELLERLLRYVLDVHGIITPQEAEDRIKGNALSRSQGKTPYLLTFDDGFKSHVTLVREILDRYGVKAIFFICPGLIDVPLEKQRQAIARNIFDPSLAEPEVADDMMLMSWADIELLVRSGHTIGSHTLSHRRLFDLSDEDLVQEITTPSTIILDRLGIPVKWFAPPWGDIVSVDPRSFQVISKQYQFCCSSLPGFNSSKTPPLGLLREGINLRSPFHYQKMVLAGGFDFLYWGRVRELIKLADTR
jgi:peptidoglycan/xylan/chitin deacetylase (PgdA/CDA1 family)